MNRNNQWRPGAGVQPVHIRAAGAVDARQRPGGEQLTATALAADRTAVAGVVALQHPRRQ